MPNKSIEINPVAASLELLQSPETQGINLSYPSLTQLLMEAVRIAETRPSLLDRRQATVELLASLVDAEACIWAWGHGDGLAQGVIPVAWIATGFAPEQMSGLAEMGLDPEMEGFYRQPILDRMAGKSQCTVSRQQIADGSHWSNSSMRGYLLRIEMDEWLHSLHYSSDSVWSDLLLLRGVGKPSFDPHDVALIDLAMTSLEWLHSSAVEQPLSPPPAGLTERQRVVMLLLLDGFSRKMIAAQLGLAEDTVGDHIKSIYRHFQVNSATELAAIFLRSKHRPNN